MNVNSSSQLVVHAPKPIRPVFNNVGRLHRRRSSAASTSTAAAAAQSQSQHQSSAPGSTLTSPVSPAFNPSSMPSPLPIDARDASEELWSIFKRTTSASPSSTAFPPASQLQRAPSAFQERASPLHFTTPPPRNALFNPLKFQPTLNAWSQQPQSDQGSDAVAASHPPQPPQHSWSVGPAHPQAALKDIQWTDDKQVITAEPVDAIQGSGGVSASPMQLDEASQ